MFVKGTTIDVNWLLDNTNQTFVHTDFDIRVVSPDGSSVYYEGGVEQPILVDDFIVPTVDTTGSVTYKFTPNAVGVWVVILCTGVESISTIKHEYTMRVSEPDTHVYQQIRLAR